jgi:hypothetical protein
MLDTELCFVTQKRVNTSILVIASEAVIITQKEASKSISVI